MNSIMSKHPYINYMIFHMQCKPSHKKKQTKKKNFFSAVSPALLNTLAEKRVTVVSELKAVLQISELL